MADGEKSDSVKNEDVERAFDVLREKLKLPSRESMKKRQELLERQRKEILKRFPK